MGETPKAAAADAEDSITTIAQIVKVAQETGIEVDLAFRFLVALNMQAKATQTGTATKQ